VATTEADPARTTSYTWASRGDINAFFGLMLDNIGDMILMATLLVGVFQFPGRFVLTRMIPGTAVGVMVGDLIFTAMAFGLARRTRRTDVTAMPLGLDTPSTFGAVFLILGPAYLAATKRGLEPDAAARHAWFLGIAMILASGVFKLACAPFSGWIRRAVPRAGLLGSLVSIALVIISFLPLLDIAASPIAGFVALAVILAALTARWQLPKGIPGALAAVVVGSVVYYGLRITGIGGESASGPSQGPGALTLVLPLPVHEWLVWIRGSWREAISYLPVAIPLALATVVGGIDCAESAAAAGDDYPTEGIIAGEGLATLVGGLFGGVIQSTPYIGHPAYKAMGGRAAYTLATALFVGLAGILGYFGWLFYLIPKAVVFPILIFVGLEITAQSFQATPKKHYPALALACVPALAYLAFLILYRLFDEVGRPILSYRPEIQQWIQIITVLANGFIITSLLWGMALARMIDGRMRAAAATFGVAAVFALVGIIHSPLRTAPIMFPWDVMQQLKADSLLKSSAGLTPYHWFAAYCATALTLAAIGHWGNPLLPTRSEGAEADEILDRG
jgi:AGZA family xanthine/uracil permease-like MFS transporter